MVIHKCIVCGSEKESDKVCSCQNCGYIMFPLPFEEKSKLIEEILIYIHRLQLSELKDDHLIYVGKEKDDNRFPSQKQIKSYIISAKNTDIFLDRMETSIEKIREHINESFYGSYDVDFSKLKYEVEQRNTQLKTFVSFLNADIEFYNYSLPETKMSYEEVPNEHFIDSLCNLLDKLLLLVKKIEKFVRLNNVYGDCYKDTIEAKFPYSKDNDYEKDILNADKMISQIMDKDFFVDLFSDGVEELEEMLQCFWNVFDLVGLLPHSRKTCKYINGDLTFSKEDFDSLVISSISSQYSGLDHLINSVDLSMNFKMVELIDLYTKAIEIDRFNLFDIDKTKLIKIGESERELEKLIGLKEVKNVVKKIKTYAQTNRDDANLNLHMCFYGNPGSGKTEVARIIAGILYENKVLPTKKVVEVSREDLVAAYVGQTPIKTMNKINEAMGGVLFIDEAYSLVQVDSTGDYGYEAVSTLIKAMEDYRGKFCVILAGYRNPMKKLLDTNPGFKSRIAFDVEFPNYSREELREITNLMLNEKGYTADEKAIDYLLDIADSKRKDPNFANAREIRNILDHLILCQNLRRLDVCDKEIGIIDVKKYIEDAQIGVHLNADSNNIKFSSEEELDQLIGLEHVKKTIRKIRAYAKKNMANNNFNLHMCFTGNPGTGKTEVARILSQILYEAGVLKEAKLIETDASGFIGKFIGETAPKTLNKIEDAMGGVLFVDEAYSLIDTKSNHFSYGDEAIAVLLKQMEDKRGQFCTILAGYEMEMGKLLTSNPGFESRIQFKLHFPDYSRKELSEIAQLMLNKLNYKIDSTALGRVLDITDVYRLNPNYSNARTLRNILDSVILNQNLRTEDHGDDTYINIIDVEEYIDENKLSIPDKKINTSSNVKIDIDQLLFEYSNSKNGVDCNLIEQCIISITDGESQGTGFIISSDGLAITCNHCLEGNGAKQLARINLLTDDGQKIEIYSEFTLIMSDPKNDIALIKFVKSDLKYKFLALEQSMDLLPLSNFLMAGFPFGGESFRSISFTTGSVASINYYNNRKVVFADMFGKPGNSGSPIIDQTNSKVIGIFWGGIKREDEVINCFTPVELVWDLIKRNELEGCKHE